MRHVRWLVAALCLSFALPAFAGDASDSWQMHKHQTKKDLRALKPGGEDAGDKKDDAKDTLKGSTAKARKKGRHAGKSVKHKANETKEKLER